MSYQNEPQSGYAVRPVAVTPPPAESLGPRSHVRWIILGLVFFGITICYVDRMVLGILAPTLREKFSISNEQYGNITAAFALSYAICQTLSGAWLDRIGTRIGYALALAAWSVVSALHAFCRGALGLGFMRAFLGVTESPAFPAATKTLAEWFPKRERALAFGFVNAGSNIGIILASWMVPHLALVYGWQWAFLGTAALGLIWLVLWVPFYRRPQDHPSVSPAELAYINSDPPEPPAKIPWSTLMRYRQTWAFGVGKFLTDPIWWFYITLLPTFLLLRFGVDLKNIGLPMITVYLMADVGSIAGGWLSSAMIARGMSLNASRKTAMFLSALSVVPVIYAAHTEHKWVAVFLIGLAMAGHQGFSSNLYTLVSDTFPKRAVASVAGLGGTFAYVGATLYSHYTGVWLDLTKKLHGSESYTLLFVFAGLAYLAAFFAVHLLSPRLTPALMQEPQE